MLFRSVPASRFIHASSSLLECHRLMCHAPLASAVRHVSPQRFPIMVRYGGTDNIDIRAVVQRFRDDSFLSPPSTAQRSNAVASSSVKPRLTADFRYELQYPSPGGLALKAQHQPQVWRLASHIANSNRSLSLMLRSNVTSNHYAVFGDGTVVAFGSGEPRDSSYLQLVESNDNAEGNSIDEESILAADDNLLEARTSQLEEELGSLQTVLRPFTELKDPMMRLTEPLSMHLTFTTFDEVRRGGYEECLQDVYSGLASASAQSNSHASAGNFSSNDMNRNAGMATGSSLSDGNSTRSSSASSSYSSYVDRQYFHQIVLAAPSAVEMMPFAFCLSEAIHLRALNQLLIPMTSLAVSWKKKIEAQGSLPMTLKDARKAKALVLRIASRHGKLGLTRHRVFWESHHAVSRAVFQDACAHFEIYTLHDELKERLDSVANTLAYLCDEAHQDTNHHLEYVIIALIVLEVVLSIQEHPMELEPDTSS